MLHRINVMLNKKTHCADETVNYEVVDGGTNAQRWLPMLATHGDLPMHAWVPSC